MRVVLSTVVALIFMAISPASAAQDANALRARYTALEAKLADNPFGRPLHVQARESGAEHQGSVHAVIEHPFQRVAASLRRAPQWCGVLILQPNVKHCDASSEGPEKLTLFVGKKSTDSLERAYRAEFVYEVAAARSDYLDVGLHAPEGPLGTTDYRIRLEAAPLDANRTFVHLAYTYTLGFAARVGMDMYLATSGRDKVGFSVVHHTAEGRPVYVSGVRGVVERNTMRYYLALAAYLDTLDAPVAERVEKRLRAFHAGLERYPRQLRELTLAEYLEIKRRDAARVLSQARG